MEKNDIWEKVGDHYEADLSIIDDLKKNNKLFKLGNKYHLPHPEGKDEWLSPSQFKYEGLRGDHEWWTYKATSGITHYLKRYRHASASKDNSIVAKHFNFSNEELEESSRITVEQTKAIIREMTKNLDQQTVNSFICTTANPKTLQFPQIIFP